MRGWKTKPQRSMALSLTFKCSCKGQGAVLAVEVLLELALASHAPILVRGEVEPALGTTLLPHRSVIGLFVLHQILSPRGLLEVLATMRRCRRTLSASWDTSMAPFRYL